MTSKSLASTPRSSRAVVLDAWPVMEWFRGREPAASRFRGLLSEASRGQVSLCISRINLGEIYYMTAKNHGEEVAEILVRQLTVVFIEVVTVSDANIDAAARLKARYRISYADAFAAVLSMSRSAALATGDRDFLALEADGILQLNWMGA